jgi:glutathione synthase
MKVLFVIDPLDGLDVALDTSVGLMHAVQDKGDEVWVTEARQLEVLDGMATTHARPLTLMPAYPDGGCRWTVPDPWHVAGPEEGLPIAFPDLAPPTVVTARPATVRAFTETVGTAVVKPVDGFSGRGVFVLTGGDPNLASILETVTARGSTTVVAQRYLPEVEHGNKRIHVLDGRPVGATVRYPVPGDFRIVSPDADADLTARDREICDRLLPTLRRHGLRMVGLDVIGDHLIEVNTTSPGALRKADSLLGTTYCADLVAHVLSHPDPWR